ncbi:MarR family transcriptional regulator [Actinacidiphila sp. DG2A-62]|uniref:MarR family winged helix-turn-helix transcriptional regulator n=1 Tax=Actinacidiphila sp. DG2A-62 TaxID=3108821 RepID=UPI002DB7B09D|nr:MarR family transcriptional regulator [Actinacidiphila sp. DG2A-62]MEC3997074.1 MarR family transcriptional regulator [Actinacidiphila sp. DG2A-62]
MDDRAALFENLEDFGERLQNLIVAQGLSFMADYELSFTQVRVLTSMANSEPMPIKSLAERLGLSVHAAGRNVDRLVKLGLVERRESPVDRRVKLVSLTSRAQEILGEDLAHRRQTFQEFVGRVPEEQVRAFNDVLRLILAGNYFAPVTPVKAPRAHE